MTAYTLFGGNAHGLAFTSDGTTYTLGVQFAVSQSAGLTGIWFYSASGAAALPIACVIYDADTQAQVSGTLNNSPSWSGAAGSGWIKCTYSGSVTLVPGTNYVSAVLGDGQWRAQLNGYWTSGGGGSGITSGPLSAPDSASALNGQALYNTGTSFAFPATSATGYDFGVDVEVTPAASFTATPNIPRGQAVNRASTY